MNIKIPENKIKEMLLAHRTASLFYYKEQHALEVKGLLDKLHADPSKPLRVQAVGVSVRTVRLQYYQGAKYLIENLDADHHYRDLYSRTKCLTYANYIELHVRGGTRSLSTHVEQVTHWREEFTRFLEEAKPNDKLSLFNLALTEEEVTWAENQLVTLIKTDAEGNEIPLFFGTIKKDSIMLIRDE